MSILEHFTLAIRYYRLLRDLEVDVGLGLEFRPKCPRFHKSSDSWSTLSGLKRPSSRLFHLKSSRPRHESPILPPSLRPS